MIWDLLSLSPCFLSPVTVFLFLSSGSEVPMYMCSLSLPLSYFQRNGLQSIVHASLKSLGSRNSPLQLPKLAGVQINSYPGVDTSADLKTEISQDHLLLLLNMTTMLFLSCPLRLFFNTFISDICSDEKVTLTSLYTVPHTSTLVWRATILIPNATIHLYKRWV